MSGQVETTRPKILIVGMLDSIHLAKWLYQFKDESHDFVLFPSSWHRRVHPLLRKLIESKELNASYRVSPRFSRWLAVPLTIFDRITGIELRSRLLKRVMEAEHFDLIHALEIQHAGYIVLGTLNRLHNYEKPLLVTNYGSDIYWYMQFARHELKLRSLLQRATHYSCECQRDVELARELGFSGEILPVRPNAGGLVVNSQPSAPSQRRTIMVKGRTGFVGRADLALEAIRRIENHLHGYTVVFVKSSLRIFILTLMLRRSKGIKVRVWIRGRPHNEILRLLSDSRIFIGISESDGICTTLLEAMAFGCYPIQTDTSCAAEWIPVGCGGIVALNVDSISRELYGALIDDSRVDRAAITNQRVVAERADLESITLANQSTYTAIVHS